MGLRHNNTQIERTDPFNPDDLITGQRGYAIEPTDVKTPTSEGQTQVIASSNGAVAVSTVIYTVPTGKILNITSASVGTEANGTWGINAAGTNTECFITCNSGNTAVQFSPALQFPAGTDITLDELAGAVSGIGSITGYLTNA